jgi:CO/xanthine dehydrogenase FAD-binding subunit
MIPFTYSRPGDAAAAIREAARAGARYLGGGTKLIDLMREGVERPSSLVDVTGLDRGVAERADGGLRIGAATSNIALAADRRVRERYPMLTRAIVAGASAQIRNMATVGGNLLQRTRSTMPLAATKGRLAPAATPSTASTACTRSWAPPPRAGRLLVGECVPATARLASLAARGRLGRGGRGAA